MQRVSHVERIHCSCTRLANLGGAFLGFERIWTPLTHFRDIHEGQLTIQDWCGIRVRPKARLSLRVERGPEVGDAVGVGKWVRIALRTGYLGASVLKWGWFKRQHGPIGTRRRLERGQLGNRRGSKPRRRERSGLRRARLGRHVIHFEQPCQHHRSDLGLRRGHCYGRRNEHRGQPRFRWRSANRRSQHGW
jgi:hypothetical protein